MTKQGICTCCGETTTITGSHVCAHGRRSVPTIRDNTPDTIQICDNSPELSMVASIDGSPADFFSASADYAPLEEEGHWLRERIGDRG